MRPVGLKDPRTGKRPYAVLQLRREDASGEMWGLVGFQTRLKFFEQKRIFQLIPALRHAEFYRYGVMPVSYTHLAAFGLCLFAGRLCDGLHVLCLDRTRFCAKPVSR